MDSAVQAYIGRYPAEIQARLLRIREIFLSEVPDSSEDIKYQMPTIVWNGNLIHYAAFAKHIGVYPLPEVLIALKEEIKGYKAGKGSIQFSNDKPLPEDLIRLIARTRLKERMAELRAKAKK